MSEFAGKVLLIIIAAGKCGYTPQSKKMEGLHQPCRDSSLVVINFPCNQFEEQEPGNERADITAGNEALL